MTAHVSPEALAEIRSLWEAALQEILDDPDYDSVDDFAGLDVIAREFGWDLSAAMENIGSAFEVKRLRAILGAA